MRKIMDEGTVLFLLALAGPLLGGADLGGRRSSATDWSTVLRSHWLEACMASSSAWPSLARSAGSVIRLRVALPGRGRERVKCPDDVGQAGSAPRGSAARQLRGVNFPPRSPGGWTGAVGIVRSFLCAVAACVVAVSVLAGCSHGPASASSVAAVSAASGGQLTMSSGARVVIPKGAVSGAGHLTGSVETLSAEPGGSARLVGSTYHFEVTGARLTGRVRLTLPVPGATGGPEPAWLAYSSGGRWIPVESSYDPGTRTVTGTSTHLSVWSVVELASSAVTSQLDAAVKGFFGIAGAAQPSCPGSAAAAGVKVSSTSGALVKWCAGTASGQAVLRVANNHGYAVEIDYPEAWPVTRLGQEADWENRVLQNVSAWMSPQPDGQSTIVVPGGGEIQFTIPAGASGEASARPSGQSVLVGAFILGVETLAMTYESLPWGPSASPSKLATVVTLADHSQSCVSAGESLARDDTLSAASIGGLIRSDTDLAVSCLGDEWETGFGVSGAVASAVVSILLWAADAVKLLVDDSWALVDAVRYLAGYEITVASSPVVPASYVGSWYSPQAGAVLSVQGNGDATLQWSGDTAQLRFVPDGSQLTGKVISGAAGTGFQDGVTETLAASSDGGIVLGGPAADGAEFYRIEDGSYYRYTNPRFNFSFDVPEGYNAGPLPEDRDGLGFTNSTNTATVSGYGENNAAKLSPSQDLAGLASSYQSSGGDVALRYLSGDVIAVSGTASNGTIFYDREVVYPAVIYALTWTYPAADKAQYNALVDATVSSFTPGPDHGD